MLEELTIKNVAVIDKLSVAFDGGLNVLTGETGAGKSIIIGSINMILGERAKKELIRSGTDKAEVEAVFTMCGEVRACLTENGIDADDDAVIINRSITADGKSRARINGSAVTVNILREVADKLINIHGQHDNQALLSPKKHINFLDNYAKSHDLLESYKRLYERRRSLEKEIELIKSDDSDRVQRADFLSYQIKEITDARLTPGEEEDLLREREILRRAVEIADTTAVVYDLLYDGSDGFSAYDAISRAANELQSICDVNESLAAAYDSIMSAMYSIEDSAREVHNFGNSVEFDEEALANAEERLDTINRLKRKYGATIDDILAFCQRAEDELHGIQTRDNRLSDLEVEFERLESEIADAASKLSGKRRAAAVILQGEIETALHELNMEKARFEISVTDKPYGSDGADNVEFLISSNPGEEPKPLVKIASGGELSRVMLAIKSVLADTDGVGTMIFDEIDTGVSGSAAEKIAIKLKKTAANAQVICITHLPQLASAADTHFLIEKNVDGDMASTHITQLDRRGRIDEIARIVGGGDAGYSYARSVIGEA